VIGKCIYEIQTLIWIGLLIFILKIGSRRRLNERFKTVYFVNHLSFLSKQQLSGVAHHDTLAHLVRGLEPELLSQLRDQMINRLLRNKCLVKFRLYGYYLITVDMTNYLTFKRRHCACCVRKKVKVGKGRKKRQWHYYHPVVEAKLVAPNGFALSIESEFVENRESGQKRQDCELKAAYRLLERLGKKYPQLRICLVLDGLYVSEGILGLCERYNWRVFIVLKKGKAPELYREYEVLKERCVGNHLEYECEGRDEKQSYWWVNDIDYKFMGRYYVNVLECVVTKKRPKKGERKKTRWLWLTNFHVTAENCMVLANGGGRLRWNVENQGFKMQKRGGYNMEHAYIRDCGGAKVFYLLMQIAHIINQLIEKGSLLDEDLRKLLGGIRAIAEWLLEELRTNFFAPGEIDKLLAARIQIRFDSS